MTDSISLKSKPRAAIFMALALITTTFAGVSFADPADGTEPMNTFLSMDYDELEIIVDFDANGTDYGNMTANFSLHEAGSSEILLLEDSSSLMEETDNISWNTHWGSFNLTLFFEQTAEDGTWYTVDVEVHAEDSSVIGYNWIDICMSNGSVCEDGSGQPNVVLSPEEEQQIFDDIDADSDGAITEQEFLDFVNMDRMNQNDTAMNSSEENETLSMFNMYDTGFQNGNDTEDANDSTLEFNEFMTLYYNEHHNSEEQSNGEMLLMQFDADMDGNLTLTEIINGINTDNENNGQEPLDNMSIAAFTAMFTTEDVDGNSVLNGDELDHFFEAMMNMGNGTDDKSAGEIWMMMFDANMDGNLTIEEYVNGVNTGKEENGEEPMDNLSIQMFTLMFMAEDMDGNYMLNIYELNNLYNSMTNMDGEGEGQGEGTDVEMMMMMLDSNNDSHLTMTELSVYFTEFDDDEAFMVTVFTNLFALHDVDDNNMLNSTELREMIDHFNRLDADKCYDVVAGDIIFEKGTYSNDTSEYDHYLMEGDSAPDDGKFCLDLEPSIEMLMFMLDTNGDGSLSSSEILTAFNDENDMSDVELEYFAIAFMMSDSNADQVLSESEFRGLMELKDSQENQDQDEGEHEILDGCVDAVNRIKIDLNKADCIDAGYQWMGEYEDHGDNQGHDNETHGENNETHGENNDTHPADDTMIESNQVDVWFEQWDDQTMELVIVELITVDNADEIARLVTMADAEYGNNDSMLDQAEINMLMNLYALTLNTDEMANGLALDGQNGTAVDFWIEVDGLLEGDDVVFLRIGTVIEFPTGAYDDSTSRTFTVTPEMDEHADNSTDAEDCGKTSIWIHNSDTWNVKTATGFTFDERNNAWYTIDEDCQDHGVITFELEKAENGALPAAEDEDWTWEDEEMNMFPICDWSYSVTFENGSSMSEQGVDKAPESGDYEIVLDDNAAYEIFLFCWDPEGGKMTVDIGSILGNSTNSSVGETMGAISFKLLAGTGGNFTFAFSWTDEYHTESGTLTVIATGDGTIDLTDIEVDGEGILPGFTVGLGVLAMLGAAMFAGRRNEA